MVTIASAPVRSESKVLGEATYPVFDSMDEAVNHPEHGLGEQQALDLINSQLKTNRCNQFRQAHTKGPTKAALRNDAIAEIFDEYNAGEHQNVVGDKLALNNLIEKRMAEIEARMKASVASESDDEDE